jgi:Protein of unknown function (DUF2442)
MSTSAIELRLPLAVSVTTTEDSLSVVLNDGRTITAPIGWYPRLLHATHAERLNWRPIGGGEGLHWPAVEEDISVEALLAGRPSGESQASLKRWLAKR